MVNKEKTKNEINRSVPQGALLFELENIAVKGRQIIYDVLKSVLADKGIELTPNTFSRYCLCPSVKHFLPALLACAKKTQLSENKLLREITEGIRLSFTDDTLKLDSGLAKILKTAGEQQIRMGVLSSLDKEMALQLATKLGLVDMRVNVLSYSCEDKNFPRADAWLKLAKNLSVPPPMCLVLATSATACKSALSAGMRCVIVPDKFTAFQDFSGADCIVDTLNDNTVENIFTLLHSY